MMQDIRKLQGIDSSQFFEQLELYSEYGEWLFHYLRKKEWSDVRFRRLNPSKGLHEKGYKKWIGLSTVYDFIKSHPEYKNKDSEIIKIIIRGDNEGWYRNILRQAPK